MQKLTAVAVALLTSLASSPAMARDYEVEVIVFDRIAREAGRAQQERWDFSSARIAARLDEMQALAARASKHPTTAKLGSLEPLRARLEARDYRILATARWQQPAAFYPRAPVIALGRDDGDVGEENAVAENTVADKPINPLAAGFVRVYRTALIYADVNLQLSPPLPAAEASPAATWQPHYFIAEKRRLKFKQIHYFDHPLFGALLQVWPVEVDEAADDVTVDADITTPQQP